MSDRPEERVLDEYLRRPEVTVGYAVVDHRGSPFPSTVADAKRAAMVNALVSIFGCMVLASESDGSIERRFKECCGTSGMRVSCVLIESVDVVPDNAPSGVAEGGEAGEEPGEISISIRRGEHGLYYATSPQLKGLLVAKSSVREVLERVPNAISELQAVAGLKASDCSGGAESGDGARGDGGKETGGGPST
jgi:hypothetical protein